MGGIKKSGLGRGLGALLPPEPESAAPSENTSLVDISLIERNPHQPRTDFSEEELSELCESVREHGVIQPLIVTPTEAGRYVLIAGERRLRAAQMAGLTAVPVVVRQANDKDMLEIALIENIQREDLSPLETAEAYKHLEETFHMTHEEISKRVGKNRASVTNTMRLLRLPPEVQEALSNLEISEGHARVLLGLPTPQAQIAAMNWIIDNSLNVRQTEEYVRSLVGERPTKSAEKVGTRSLSPELQYIQESLMNSFGTKVSLKPGKSGAGMIQIHYYSDEELENLVRRFNQ